ncbi:efflux RND transporter permease subunit [Synechococcus sp. PCC 7336]|uniref:efflux RND transporter permease subunit n=1 Tax=Synechococcus sp. PCC 7336 TaxID=195250 RepID=UPI000345C9D6|nr:multidrug efflux RND transporter permease subunit [Synechococcus sp. PCC 7336]
MFSATFIRRPVLATVCSLLIVLVGAVSASLLPVDYYPTVSPPTISVTSNYTGASAEVVETATTNILERAINGTEGMRYISSTSSSDGTSQLLVTFQQGRNLDAAAIDVQRRIEQVESQLPEQVLQTGVTVAKADNSAFVQFINFSAPGGEYDRLFISNYADLFVRDVLRRIDGVSDVRIFGERRYAMRIWLDPLELASRGLTAEDVVEAVEDQNVQVAAGAVGQSPSPEEQLFQFSVRARGRLQTSEEFGDIVLLTGSDGSLVRVRDVGRVELGAQSYDTAFTVNGKEAVGMGITKLNSANTLAVTQQVRQTMAELADDFPPGLTYQIPYDTSKFVNQSILEIIFTLLQAIFWVVLVIFVFLQEWRATLIPAITIPVSLVGTFAFMQVMGFSINTLTLFGLTLATGLVVDDAIVVVENITSKVEQGLSPVEASLTAMQEIFGAVIATTLVLFAVFIPVAFFPGTSGQIYRQFALTIAFSVGLSTFNALTLSPALAALFSRPASETQHPIFRTISGIIDRLRQTYRHLLNWVAQFKTGMVVAFVALTVATAWLYRAVPTGFLPTEDQGYFINIVQGPPGTSLNYTQQILDEAVDALQEVPEVESTVAIGGFSFAGNSPTGGLIFVPLKPWSERAKPWQSATALVGQMRGRLLGGISEGLVIPIDPPAIRGLGTGGGFDLQLQGRSQTDFNTLSETAGGFFGQGMSRPEISVNPPTFSANTPQLLVTVDRDKAQLLGVELPDIFDTLQTLLGSNYVNDFDAFNRSYRVYVQVDQQYRTNPEDIGQFYVRSQTTDSIIPLDSLVTVETVTGPPIINHYNLFRSVQVSGSANPGFGSGQAIAVMEDLASQLMPPGIGFEWTGVSLEQLESGGQSALLFLLGLVFVFLFLAAQYESFVDPFIVMLSVPLAILGALLFVLARGLTNDIFCQVGLVMLIGLASKNSILIVEFANQLRQQGHSIAAAALDAAEARFRAILMTAFSFILGVMPLVLASGAGAGSRRSLGTAVFGGMLVSTLLSLLVVPVLYIVIRTLEERLRHWGKPAIAAASPSSTQGHSPVSSNGLTSPSRNGNASGESDPASSPSERETSAF